MPHRRLKYLLLNTEYIWNASTVNCKQTPNVFKNWFWNKIIPNILIKIGKRNILLYPIKIEIFPSFTSSVSNSYTVSKIFKCTVYVNAAPLSVRTPVQITSRFNSPDNRNMVKSKFEIRGSSIILNYKFRHTCP